MWFIELILALIGLGEDPLWAPRVYRPENRNLMPDWMARGEFNYTAARDLVESKRVYHLSSQLLAMG